MRKQGSQEDYIMKGFPICTPHQYYLGDQTKKNETYGRCSTCGGRGEVHTGFWWGDLREGDHLEDPGIDGRIILKWILKRWWDAGGMGRINLAQDGGGLV